MEAKFLDIVKKLRTREWQVPTFQREFVWSVAAVRALGESLCRGRPVGMVTVWTQKRAPSAVVLHPLSLPNGDSSLELPFLEPEVEAPTAARGKEP